MARPIKAARSGNVRSLERGLSLLVAMNRRKLASASDLAKDTRLPRPTVYRLLDTLCEAGFVSRDSATDRYRPAHGVRSLSDGYLDDEWVSEIAAPMMATFTREHVWPVALFTFEAGKMLVRDTTHRLSSLSIDYGMVGRRMGMLRTAGGLVYLAFCPDNERKVILDLLAQSRGPGGSTRRASRNGSTVCSRQSAPRAMPRRSVSSIRRPRAFRCRSSPIGISTAAFRSFSSRRR